jgi:hypothetical protein
VACHESQIVRQPWEINPYSLLNWWDVEKFAAEKFCTICSRLSGLCQVYNELSTFPSSQGEKLQQSLRRIANDCLAIGLEIFPLQVETAIKRLEASSANPLHELEAKQVSQILYDLGTLLVNEMTTRLFLWVPRDKAIFYEQESLFGASVDGNFHSAIKDIKSAGTCYATDRNTACVMHLMRVLEVGLNTLAVELNVAFERRNWENVINDMEVEIKKINGPAWGADWKAKQQFYSEAAKDFRYFKDAWRNHAMHYREHYEASEAKIILDHVKSFMAHLADNELKERPVTA